MRAQRDYLVRLHPRPDTIYASQSRTVLATARDGCITGDPDHGFFVHQTRLLSRYRYLIDGKPPLPVALSNVEQHTWLGYYISLPPRAPSEAPDTGSGHVQEVTEETLELRVSRFIGSGMHEDLDLTNFMQCPTSFRLEIEIDADFDDQIETLGEPMQGGTIERRWVESTGGVWELTFDHVAEHHYDHQGNAGTARIHRGITIRIARASSAPRYSENRLEFAVELAPHGSWHACLSFIPYIEDEPMPAGYPCRSFFGVHHDYDARREAFLNESTIATTPESQTLSAVVVNTLEQAKRDLASLRLYDLDHGDRSWTMAAGLPIYVALFGRDTLTAAWQAALVGPGMMQGTLAELARWQGTRFDDWRDEQPGRMLHEAHTGPLEILNFNPRARYYGSATTSGFYPVVVSELWHWTGDKDLVRPFLEPALRALRWRDQSSDLDRDGFYEYLTRSEQGTKNQGWKDSADAIVYEDGSQVEPPIATCEEQSYVYAAKLHMSELLWWLDEKDEAKRLYREASELKKRFNEVFWMEDEGFFALGLDSQSRQIRSISSNTGHLLAAGIVDESLVERTAGRLVAGDLFTGWGVRTLSANHPAYNPYSYHRGSVWPAENGTFALGFFRHGLHQYVELICRALFEAAALFDFFRLPELFSGHQRDSEHPFPALYPQANSPQAWSASATFLLLQSLLGLYPYAPLHVLLVDPHLPEWLPEITLHKLRVGKAVTAIRFYRQKDGHSDYEVQDVRGPLHVLRQPSPWSLTSGWVERLQDAISSLVRLR